MSGLTPDETILGLLAAQTRHGYELIDCFRTTAQLGRVWSMSTSQIYAVLKRLETQGLIDGRQVTQENAPPRTEYTLTEAGEVRLLAWLYAAAPSPSIRRVRVEFLSRLYIARLLNAPTGEIVREQRTACIHERERLRQEQEHAAPGIDYLALEFVIGQLDAVLQWIDRCELVPKEEEEK